MNNEYSMSTTEQFQQDDVFVRALLEFCSVSGFYYERISKEIDNITVKHFFKNRLALRRKIELELSTVVEFNRSYTDVRTLEVERLIDCYRADISALLRYKDWLPDLEAIMENEKAALNQFRYHTQMLKTKLIANMLSKHVASLQLDHDRLLTLNSGFYSQGARHFS